MQLLNDLKENMLEIERGGTRSHCHFGGSCRPDVKGSLRGDLEVTVANGERQLIDSGEPCEIM
jgi:hypothetical protein